VLMATCLPLLPATLHHCWTLSRWRQPLSWQMKQQQQQQQQTPAALIHLHPREQQQQRTPAAWCAQAQAASGGGSN
jgi:hypothetical protein